MSPGYLLDASSALLCAHGGQAKPTAPAPRVKIGGQSIVTQATIHAVSACGLTGTPNPPCATAQWVAAATRVKSLGQFVLLADSQSTCAPTGTPLTVTLTQIRVKGT
jgi:hypothetical protein